MTETFTTVGKDTVPTLTSKLDIKPTDVVLTDSRRITEILVTEGAQPKSLIYANRVALDNELLKYTGNSKVKLVLENYSENTIKFIKQNKIQAEVYYPTDSKKVGLAIDKLEEMGGTTKPPIIHHYR